MVDLFAVLAIVFMIHSNEEITVAQTENDARIQELVAGRNTVDVAELARMVRREEMANAASMSLEQIREDQERRAQELLSQFTAMLANQQSNAASNYENILASIENEHEEVLRREVLALEQEKQTDLEEITVELERDFEVQRSALAAQQERRLEEAREEFDRVVTSTETRLADARDALDEADQARTEALSRQAALDQQRQTQAARTERELAAQAAREAESLRRDAELALARAEQERSDALARQASALDEQRRQEVARAEQDIRAQADREAENLRREADQALARADQERQAELDAQRATLEEERARALAAAADQLAPYVEAIEARNQIIDELRENFGDFDNSAVEIDPETGKVKLHFEKSYFALGSFELSEDMKDFLRAMIPRYASSIYGNGDAAAHVESLNISGMASPVYRGVYVDMSDRSPETETARQYNMTLSNRRAEALYAFIFDENEMGDYEFRTRMQADMSIAALGFQNASPVRADLVGKPARCIEYDCQQEQATILQFQLFSGGL